MDRSRSTKPSTRCSRLATTTTDGGAYVAKAKRPFLSRLQEACDLVGAKLVVITGADDMGKITLPSGRVSYFHRLRWDLNTLARLDIEDETGRLMVQSYQRYDVDRMKISAENLLWASFGVSAAAMDRSLDDTFGAKNPTATDDRGAARALVYQIRNCFAHDPLNPKWRIDERYRRPLRIEQIGVTWDGAACDGQPVSPAHFGGWPGNSRS